MEDASPRDPTFEELSLLKLYKFEEDSLLGSSTSSEADVGKAIFAELTYLMPTLGVGVGLESVFCDTDTLTGDGSGLQLLVTGMYPSEIGSDPDEDDAVVWVRGGEPAPADMMLLIEFCLPSASMGSMAHGIAAFV